MTSRTPDDDHLVTRDDLRSALASAKDQPKKRPVLLDWTSALSDADRDELERLRAGVNDLRARIIDLERAAENGARRKLELRSALNDLAGASLFGRRGVATALRRRGLVS